MGRTAIPLSDLQHQRRVDRWFALIGEDGEGAGEVRLILQYRLNRWGEALSRFWPEPPYVPDLPGFAPNRVFGHVKDLVVETKPYLALLQSVGVMLQWTHPLTTLLCLVIVLALTLNPRYIYSSPQLLLVLRLLLNYVQRRGRAQTLEVERATAARCACMHVSLHDVIETGLEGCRVPPTDDVLTYATLDGILSASCTASGS